jgi:hypothetical protein
MTASIAALTLTLAMNATGQGNSAQTVPYYYPYQMRHARHSTNFILPPGPGDGWGFPNDFPDRYGWADYGAHLPLAADRTAEYFFPRYYSVPPEQMFLQCYYNPYQTRGQRYIPYVAGGGAHPAGGQPLGPSDLPVSPYAAVPETQPVAPVPRLNGRVEAPPIPSGTSGLTP